MNDIKEGFTQEELDALKEIAKDRLAVSRVWGKVKLTLLGVAGAILAYLTIVENVVTWIKIKIGVH